MRRNLSNYALEGDMGEATYTVTVTPAYGPPRTFHVQQETGETVTGYLNYRNRRVSEGSFLVKSAPTSRSYFGKPHKSFEAACIAANSKARAYGYACRKPLPRLAEAVAA
jgi:hypothetical protein